MDGPQALTFTTLIGLRENGFRNVSFEGLMAAIRQMSDAFMLHGIVTDDELRKVVSKTLTSAKNGNFIRESGAYYRILPVTLRNPDLKKTATKKAGKAAFEIVTKQMPMALRKFSEACQCCQN